jgi:hypothetical protein
MIQLKVPWPSPMDNNLEDYVRSYVNDKDWVSKVKLLPGVKDAEWVSATRSNGNPHTLITFESEADKTWFILRWS